MKKQNLLLILGILGLFCLIATQPLTTLHEDHRNAIIGNFKPKAATDAPISINGNAALAAFCAGNVTEDRSQSNPYMIQNYIIKPHLRWNWDRRTQMPIWLFGIA